MQLTIRDFPDSLWVVLKNQAVEAGCTLRELVIRVCESSLGIPGGEQVTCPLCGQAGPLVMSGTNARCFHCGSGFMPPEGV